MSEQQFQAEIMDELKQKEQKMSETKNKKTGLELLREPFPDHQISKLPKPTKAQTEEVRNDYKKGVRCSLCGGWHHKDVVHLDYVGHAALTDRLLDCDINWNWKPIEFGGLAAGSVDKDGGMWIELTVCGVSRIGYGDADGKTGPNAVKERIGDALRNAAMRFGAALDLWHKGELHLEEDEPKLAPVPKAEPKPEPVQPLEYYKGHIGKAKSLAELQKSYSEIYPVIKNHPAILTEVDKVKEDLKSLFNEATNV